MPGGAAAVIAASRRRINAGDMPTAAMSRTRTTPLGGPSTHLSDEVDVASYPLPREELLRNIKRFQARDKYCWSLPIACLGYITWCLGLTMHVDIGAAFQVESGCVWPPCEACAHTPSAKPGSQPFPRYFSH